MPQVLGTWVRSVAMAGEGQRLIDDALQGRRASGHAFAVIELLIA